jgi:hypothetical protein
LRPCCRRIDASLESIFDFALELEGKTKTLLEWRLERTKGRAVTVPRAAFRVRHINETDRITGVGASLRFSNTAAARRGCARLAIRLLSCSHRCIASRCAISPIITGLIF